MRFIVRRFLWTNQGVQGEGSRRGGINRAISTAGKFTSDRVKPSSQAWATITTWGYGPMARQLPRLRQTPSQGLRLAWDQGPRCKCRLKHHCRYHYNWPPTMSNSGGVLKSRGAAWNVKPLCATKAKPAGCNAFSSLFHSKTKATCANTYNAHRPH
jgi:hypothetical protein